LLQGHCYALAAQNKALWVWQNWMIRANETETWGSWINWAPVQYILVRLRLQLVTCNFVPRASKPDQDAAEEHIAGCHLRYQHMKLTGGVCHPLQYNGVFVLLPAYYSSMDDLMTALVDQFHSVSAAGAMATPVGCHDCCQMLQTISCRQNSSDIRKLMTSYTAGVCSAVQSSLLLLLLLPPVHFAPAVEHHPDDSDGC
jgi:hypothetical protein